MRLLAALLLMLPAAVLLASIAVPPPRSPEGFDLQGHRGARGARPENTWPAFRHALRARAVTLELDVAVTAGRRLVVSHEPWMNPASAAGPTVRRFPRARGSNSRSSR
jgi:glycerophosphoryl diester phosphodiesterase